MTPALPSDVTKPIHGILGKITRCVRSRLMSGQALYLKGVPQLQGRQTWPGSTDCDVRTGNVIDRSPNLIEVIAAYQDRPARQRSRQELVPTHAHTVGSSRVRQLDNRSPAVGEC